MTHTETHSPLPWVARQEFANRWRIEVQKEGSVPLSVATVTTTLLEVGTGDNKTTEANAALIVRSVNALPSLVEALEFADEILRENTSINTNCIARDKIRAALALAKGE